MWLIVIILCAARQALGQTDDQAGQDSYAYFQRGRIELIAGGGYGSFNNSNYLILLLGGGYYLRDGLSLGLTGEAWVGSQPQFYDVSPQIRYVFLDLPWRFKPYLGTFYRRTFYTHEFGPLDSAGGRTGLVFPLSPRAYLTGGAVYEHYFNCNKNVYTSCDEVYPEIGLEFGF